MKNRSLLALITVTVVTVLACSRGQPPQEQRRENASEASAASMETHSLALHSMNDSDITGNVTLTPAADTWNVELQLDHLTPGNEYTSSVRHGSCEAQGPEAVTLNSVLATEDGTGRSTTRVPASALDSTATETMHEGYFIQVLHPDGEPAACVDLPSGESMSA